MDYFQAFLSKVYDMTLLLIYLLRYIHSMNRKNLTYKLQMNRFADLRDNELKHITGLRVHLNNFRVEDDEMFLPTISAQDLPDEIDWRLYGKYYF